MNNLSPISVIFADFKCAVCLTNIQFSEIQKQNPRTAWNLFIGIKNNLMSIVIFLLEQGYNFFMCEYICSHSWVEPNAGKIPKSRGKRCQTCSYLARTESLSSEFSKSFLVPLSYLPITPIFCRMLGGFYEVLNIMIVMAWQIWIWFMQLCGNVRYREINEKK